MSVDPLASAMVDAMVPPGEDEIERPEGFIPRYGVVVEMRIRSGKMNEFLWLIQDLLNRRFSKPEFGSTMAEVLTSAHDPDSCMLWEQFKTKADFDAVMQDLLHGQKRLLGQAKDLFEEPPLITEGEMDHWQTRDVRGPKYGCITRCSCHPGKRKGFEELYVDHFERRLAEGLEPNATLVSSMRPISGSVLFLEQWEKKAHYDKHIAHPNHKAFLDLSSKFTKGTPAVVEGEMMHWQVANLARLDEMREASSCAPREAGVCCSIL